MSKTKEAPLQWPDFYPEQLALPPEDASDTEGAFYRFVLKYPPESGCFLTTHEECPNRHKSKNLTDEKRLCLYGTSFFSDKELALDKRESLPEALGHRKLAYGILKPYMGKMKKTLSKGHYTAWLKVGCCVHEQFKGVE